VLPPSSGRRRLRAGTALEGLLAILAAGAWSTAIRAAFWEAEAKNAGTVLAYACY